MSLSPSKKPASLWPWDRVLQLAVGLLCVLHAVVLVPMRVTHSGVVLPALLGLVAALTAWYRPQWHTWLASRPWVALGWNCMSFGVGLWVGTLVGYWGWLWGNASPHLPPGFQPVAVVVLGSSTPGGQPSPTLMQRLQVAAQLAQQHPQAWVVSSGGVDFGQTVSEAEVMARTLEGLGVPAQRLLQERQSTSTHENLQFSAQVLAQHGVAKTAPVAVVTSDFHTLRAVWIAQRAGYTQVRAVGAPTPAYVRLAAWTREYLACAAGLMLGEF